MASHDLRRILAGWDYEPHQITVRKIAGDDGAIKIQMRLPLGVLQMEISGRPDGLRPYGFESLLDYHQHRLDEHLAKNGTELGYELSPEECQALRDESVMYYHRYLAEFVLEEFEAVERDTARNLRVLDLCRKHAREESDRLILEQYRPYLVMMNTRAQAHSALRSGSLKTALARVNAGIATIKDVLREMGSEETEESTELSILESLRDEIFARLPADPIEKLGRELEQALREERYEDAANLRDRMSEMQARRREPAPKKRKK
jgi:hypothetical protein